MRLQQPIGFDWQPYASGACGKYSLQHSLLLLGIPVTQRDVNKATGVPPILTVAFGTNTDQLKRGLKYFHCRPIERSFKDPERLRKDLDALLEQGCPAILSVESDDHWIVIAGKKSKNKYYWIDSADSNLIGCWKWSDIVDWIDNDEYYLIGIIPKNKRLLNHSIVHRWTKVYEQLDDDGLCEYWGYYLEDLREMFDNPPDGEESIGAEEFFARYGKLVHNATVYYYIDASEDHMSWEIGNYRKVAEMHRLRISIGKIPEAIACLSAALTCISWENS